MVDVGQALLVATGAAPAANERAPFPSQPRRRDLTAARATRLPRRLVGRLKDVVQVNPQLGKSAARGPFFSSLAAHQVATPRVVAGHQVVAADAAQLIDRLLQDEGELAVAADPTVGSSVALGRRRRRRSIGTRANLRRILIFRHCP